MWVIAEDGTGVNLSSATHLDVCESADVQENLPRPFAVVARFAWQGFFQVVCTCYTEKASYEMIQDMTSEMCGWIAPQNTEEITDDDREN